jgi:hypothetical protein
MVSLQATSRRCSPRTGLTYRIIASKRKLDDAVPALLPITIQCRSADHFAVAGLLPSDVFLKDWGTQFVETEELKDPLTVDVEHPQVIRFVQVVLDRLKMAAIALLGECERNLEGDELAGSSGFAFLEEFWIVQGFV